LLGYNYVFECLLFSGVLMVQCVLWLVLPVLEGGLEVGWKQVCWLLWCGVEWLVGCWTAPADDVDRMLWCDFLLDRFRLGGKAVEDPWAGSWFIVPGGIGLSKTSESVRDFLMVMSAVIFCSFIILTCFTAAV